VRVQRLDVGVDVVVVPEQDLVILHPDLSFGQAVGALQATLPDMHPDAVLSLVAQVTQRPRSRRLRRSLVAVGVLALVLASVGAYGLLQRSDPYDHRWDNVVAEMQMDCADAGRGPVCVDRQGARYEVTAYTRSDSALYVMRSDRKRRYVRSFENDIPRDWLEKNPAAVVLGETIVEWE
jgi:hypothetical protein